jgi:regulatory protein YycI of two-component signal transduction system YycFG
MTVMSLDEFRQRIQSSIEPAISTYALALWYDAKGDWRKAHQLIQDLDTIEAAWIHAYLHRKEGDRANASYWYHRAHQKTPSYSLEQEWEELVKAFLP